MSKKLIVEIAIHSTNIRLPGKNPFGIISYTCAVCGINSSEPGEIFVPCEGVGVGLTGEITIHDKCADKIKKL